MSRSHQGIDGYTHQKNRRLGLLEKLTGASSQHADGMHMAWRQCLGHPSRFSGNIAQIAKVLGISARIKAASGRSMRRLGQSTGAVNMAKGEPTHTQVEAARVGEGQLTLGQLEVLLCGPMSASKWLEGPRLGTAVGVSG